MKKIIILGKSEKFTNIIKKLYFDYEINIFSWRKQHNTLNSKTSKKISFIFICGYDYKSQWYDYNKYYNANVLNPIEFIKKNADKRTTIIYIDTIDKIKSYSKLNSNKFILSRYEFAKKMLRYELTKKFNKIKIIELPPIVDNNSNADIFGGSISKKIFNLMINFGIIDHISHRALYKKFLNIDKLKKNQRFKKPKSKMLNIPRPLFIDRCLRLITN